MEEVSFSEMESQGNPWKSWKSMEKTRKNRTNGKSNWDIRPDQLFPTATTIYKVVKRIILFFTIDDYISI